MCMRMPYCCRKNPRNFKWTRVCVCVYCVMWILCILRATIICHVLLICPYCRWIYRQTLGCITSRLFAFDNSAYTHHPQKSEIVIFICIWHTLCFNTINISISYLTKWNHKYQDVLAGSQLLISKSPKVYLICVYWNMCCCCCCCSMTMSMICVTHMRKKNVTSKMNEMKRQETEIVKILKGNNEPITVFQRRQYARSHHMLIMLKCWMFILQAHIQNLSGYSFSLQHLDRNSECDSKMCHLVTQTYANIVPFAGNIYSDRE